MTKMRIVILLSFVLIFTPENGLGREETWIPAPMDNILWWGLHRYNIEVANNRGHEIKTVFYGDSLTHAWDIPIWIEEFSNYSAVNFGISGDQIQNNLYRVMYGEVEPLLNPNMIVLMIGGNNMLGGYTVDEIIYGIFHLIKTMSEYLPSTKILLLGIIPSNEGPQFWDDALAINVDLRAMADNQTVFFLEMWEQFLEGSPGYGYVHSDIYWDGIHLTRKGYQIYADALRSTFQYVWAAPKP